MKKQEKSKREINKYRKISKLLSSAFDLFVENGFDNTSIDEITKQSKVAKGTFYLYFKDKLDIRNRIIIEKSNEILEAAYLEIESRTFNCRKDKLIAFFDYIINYLADDTGLLKLIHKNISLSLYKQVLEENDGDNIINTVLEEFRAEFADVFTGEEFLINLFILLEMIGSVIYSSIIHQEPFEIEVMKPYLYRNIRKIISD